MLVFLTTQPTFPFPKYYWTQQIDERCCRVADLSEGRNSFLHFSTMQRVSRFAERQRDYFKRLFFYCRDNFSSISSANKQKIDSFVYRIVLWWARLYAWWVFKFNNINFDFLISNSIISNNRNIIQSSSISLVAVHAYPVICPTFWNLLSWKCIMYRLTWQRVSVALFFFGKLQD